MRPEDLGVIGNCQFSALVHNSGEIVWCCFPRFDSEPVCSTLLDSQDGGRFRISPANGESGTQRYVPNTNILETTFQTSTGSFRVIDFAPRFLQFGRAFRPTQLMRIVEPIIFFQILRPPGDTLSKDRLLSRWCLRSALRRALLAVDEMPEGRRVTVKRPSDGACVRQNASLNPPCRLSRAMKSSAQFAYPATANRHTKSATMTPFRSIAVPPWIASKAGGPHRQIPWSRRIPRSAKS
jgi:hypothetical protein